ncbi:hypothetical protein [Clostridium taeniosporum]|uniref:DUF3139 domain-containing protein n=1 Tax=Clostridium taeniosporum TaxID=394958 RepID=A0A1D7XP52_9CLOT|nr:hypothetical protein [Clostridium taeniosporum]AOR25108.1 hypothetical protein BGI42_15305 [Clostridium taeniosporum]
MKSVGIVLFIIFLLLYEKVLRPIICKKKIYEHINNLSGQVDNIEKLTARDEIYNVYYTVNGQANHSIVKFNLFYKTKWK